MIQFADVLRITTVIVGLLYLPLAYVRIKQDNVTKDNMLLLIGFVLVIFGIVYSSWAHLGDKFNAGQIFVLFGFISIITSVSVAEWKLHHDKSSTMNK